MIKSKKSAPSNTTIFDPKESIRRAKCKMEEKPQWSLEYSGDEYRWGTKMDRINIIRKGLPYGAVEVLSQRAYLSVKELLGLLNIPQTTYNKKKRDGDVLSGRDTELILILTELLDFGLEVFNNESDKLQRWLKKPNIALGGLSPKSLFDSLTGIQEVKNCLNRLEYGNMS